MDPGDTRRETGIHLDEWSMTEDDAHMQSRLGAFLSCQSTYQHVLGKLETLTDMRRKETHAQKEMKHADMRTVKRDQEGPWHYDTAKTSI